MVGSREVSARRLSSGILVAGALWACTQSFSPAPTPAVIAAMPDTIPCGHAVVVQARDEQKGADAERKWLDAYYPHHGDHAQALQMNGDKRFDVLTFKRANGRDASVCFDITSFYGRF